MKPTENTFPFPSRRCARKRRPLTKKSNYSNHPSHSTYSTNSLGGRVSESVPTLASPARLTVQTCAQLAAVLWPWRPLAHGPWNLGSFPAPPSTGPKERGFSVFLRLHKGVVLWMAMVDDRRSCMGAHQMIRTPLGLARTTKGGSRVLPTTLEYGAGRARLLCSGWGWAGLTVRLTGDVLDELTAPRHPPADLASMIAPPLAE